MPDFYVYSMVDYKPLRFADDIKAILLTPKGYIWYSNKTKTYLWTVINDTPKIIYRLYLEGIITTGCSMNFYNFPFDSHRCKVLFGSTGFTDSVMTFNSTMSYSTETQRPLQYTVNYFHISLAVATYIENIFLGGNFNAEGGWNTDSICLWKLFNHRILDWAQSQDCW